MIKKISAVVLALVLCLSVVVLPASAAGFDSEYALPDGALFAYKVELDKEYYKQGDVATVSVYLYVNDDTHLASGSLILGMDSTVFSKTDNPQADVKANAYGNALYNSYFKEVPSSTVTWQSATIGTNIENDANATAEENAAYDQYLKLVIAKNTNGDHENASSTNSGLSGAEINAETDPFVTFKLVVSADVADASTIKIGVPSGSFTKKYTAFKYYNDPGNSTATTNTASTSSFDLSNASASATVGEAVTPLNVAYANRCQIKFDMNADKSYAGTFDVRTFAELTNFNDVFENVADATDTTDGDGLIETGFLFNVDGTIDLAAAKTQIETGTGSYSVSQTPYISTSFMTGKYVMACIVTDIPTADKDHTLYSVAYVKYMQGGVEKVAIYETVQDDSLSTLYNTYFSQQFPNA